MPRPNSYARALKEQRDRGRREGYRVGMRQAEDELARLITGLLVKYDMKEVVFDDTELVALAAGRRVSRTMGKGATVYRLEEVEAEEEAARGR